MGEIDEISNASSHSSWEDVELVHSPKRSLAVRVPNGTVNGIRFAPRQYHPNGKSRAQARKPARRNEHCLEHGMVSCTRCKHSKSKKQPPQTGALRKLSPLIQQNRSPLADLVGGGLRIDCFNAFPIASDGVVPNAVDHLATCLAPSLFPNMPDYKNPIMAIAFPFALQNPDVFQSLVSYAQSHQDSLARKHGEPSPGAYYHWGKAIQQLHAKMSDPARCADDAAIMTNIFLMGTANRMKDQAAGEIFYKGLMRMVEIRGGKDNLGLNGYVKMSIMHVEALQLAQESAAPDTSHPQKDLHYPRHPFSPELCVVISKLPSGFEDLALQGLLSEEIIRVTERLFYWANVPGKPIAIEDEPSEHATELRRVAKLVTEEHATEQVACIALLILSTELFLNIHLNTMTDARWERVKRFCFNELESKLERELRSWTLMIAANAATDHESMTDSGEMAMDYLLENEPFTQDWAKFLSVLKKFYCNAILEKQWHMCWEAHIARRQGSPGKIKT